MPPFKNPAFGAPSLEDPFQDMRLASLEARVAALEAVVQINGSMVEIHGSRIRVAADNDIELSSAGGKLTMNPSGVSLNAPARLDLMASTINATAGAMTFNAGMANYSGVLKSDTLITNTVIATTYTPGAGNIW